MANANNKYSDRLFHFLFGHEERKDWTLSLYNAVRGSNYTNKDDIQINTIEDVLYLGMHNDISFLITDELNLFEQQSTYNPNMPMRMLQYTGQLFEKYVKQHNLDKYGPYPISLPIPKLVVFYNGTADKPDEMVLSLSDSFPAYAEPDIDVKVRMININQDHSRKLLDACRPLREYSWLIGRIRENRSSMSLKEAIDKALDEMPRSFLIYPPLAAHRAEVNEMLETEYREEEILETVRAASEARGEAHGEIRGADKLAALLKKLTPGSDEYYRALNASPEERNAMYLKYGIM